jgi:AAA+ superfamily predicted ATPase
MEQPIKNFQSFLNEGITSSMNKFLGDLFDKYNRKDYFGYIEYDKKRFDTGVFSHIADTWEEYLQKQKDMFINNTQNLVQEIEQKNCAALIQKIRYDQLISQEVFQTLTGISLKGLNNQKIKAELERYCGQ